MTPISVISCQSICSIHFIFVPGRYVFFTETFKEDEDGVLEWVSDGGEAFFVPHINRNLCPLQVRSAWYDW